MRSIVKSSTTLPTIVMPPTPQTAAGGAVIWSPMAFRLRFPSDVCVPTESLITTASELLAAIAEQAAAMELQGVATSPQEGREEPVGLTW